MILDSSPLLSNHPVIPDLSLRLHSYMSMSQPITIATFFSEPEFDDYPFDGGYYRDSYETLATMLASKGARFCITRDQETYVSGNRFSGGWVFEQDSWKRVNRMIEADVIFNRGNLQPDEHANVINCYELDQLCTDKYRSYMLFKRFSPMTVKVNAETDIHSALTHIHTAKVVAKPIDGEEGHGIVIDDRETIMGKIPHFPYLLQEFMDTSGGIPGVVEGRHDLRIVVIEGRIVDAYIRQPRKGSLLANVSQGGKLVFLPVHAVPKTAIGLFTEVESIFKRYRRRVYALDLCLDASGKWKIIELNSKPGLPESSEPNFQSFSRHLTHLLMTAARENAAGSPASTETCSTLVSA